MTYQSLDMRSSRPGSDFHAASRRMYISPSGCACDVVKTTSESNDRCYTCDACTRWQECKELKSKGKGPDHWKGQASKTTGQDVRDFANEKATDRYAKDLAR
jgi:hypothetical protein